MYRYLLLAVFVIFLINLPYPGKARFHLQHFNAETNHYAQFIDFNTFFDDPPGLVYDIFLDNYGYVWFASENVLARFDGNHVKSYHNDWTPNALPSSKTTTVKQDNSGRLWVGTERGLCLYDYTHDHFIPVLVPDTTDENPDDYHVRALFLDGDSLLWADMLSGILKKMDLNTFQVLEAYRHTPTHQPYYPYSALIRDARSQIWVGGRNFGPFVLDESSGRFQSVPAGNPLTPGFQYEYDAAYFHTDLNGDLWMGRLSGIYKYDYAAGWFKKMLGSSSWAMAEANDSTFWLGTGSGLLHYVNEQPKAYYPFNEENPGALYGDFIVDVMADKRNNIWVSTSHGVMVLKPLSKGTKRLFHIPGMDETPASSAITSLAADSRGMVWIGTKNRGVDKYNPRTGEISHFNKENTTGMISNNIRCITITEKDDIYTGMWEGKGFGKLFPDERMFYSFTYDTNDTRSDWYNDLTFDDKGNLYLGFWGGPGLTLFDTTDNTFGISLKEKFYNAFSSRLITDLHFDSGQRLWVGTTQTGLHCYFADADTAISYLPENAIGEGIKDQQIYVVREDLAGGIWVGAEGLYYLAPHENISFVRIPNPKPFKNLEVYKILPLPDNNVLLITNQGLWRYNAGEGVFVNYSSATDLQFESSTSALLLLNSGELVVGGTNGIAILDLDETTDYEPFPEVYLTSLQVFDKVKTPNLQITKDILLKHNENFITIQVGSSHWGKEDPFTYFYMLDGFNRDWIEMKTTERLARFTNIPPGNYLFKVKVINPNGEVFDNAIVKNVQVVPAVWQRKWFFPLILLAVFAIVFLIWKNRMQSLRLSLANSELNQKLLRLQMNPHFIFNSLFAIQSFIYSKQTHLAGDYLSDFARLIRLILDNSRFEFISFEKEYETVSLYLKLQQLRFNNAFSYHVDYDARLIHQDYFIPPMLAQPFLENAIEHGIKKLDRPGRITISYALLQNYIYVKVQDNGIGLNAAAEQKKHDKDRHDPVAIDLCKKRLKTLNRKKQGRIDFKIEEIENEKGQAEGTVVQFRIPVEETKPEY